MRGAYQCDSGLLILVLSAPKNPIPRQLNPAVRAHWILRIAQNDRRVGDLDSLFGYSTFGPNRRLRDGLHCVRKATSNRPKCCAVLLVPDLASLSFAAWANTLLIARFQNTRTRAAVSFNWVELGRADLRRAVGPSRREDRAFSDDFQITP